LAKPRHREEEGDRTRFNQRSGFRGGRYRKRRAVSEIVSTLLLVAIVVSLGVLVFTFASGGLGALTGSFTGLISGQGNVAAEHFVVEQVTFTFTGTTGADVYVRNVGTVVSTLVSVFTVDQSTGAFVSQVTISTAVNVGSLVDIPHTTLTFTPLHGHSYSFTVTSSLGNSVTFNAKAI
jgi:flagellin-like protein